MPTSSLALTKFDVAERQLNQAIQLFFDGGDPVSIHTLAEAAAQVMYDIRDKIGAKSALRDSDRIRPDKKKEWLAALAKSRNFFKHADKDRDAIHEFKEEYNHYSLMDAVVMLSSAKAEWTPETIIYFAWFTSRHPGVVKPNNKFSELMNTYRSGLTMTDEQHRSLCARAIRELREGRQIAGVSTNFGLQTR